MRREEIMDDLITIMEDFKENNDGAYPLAIEEALRALKSGVSSRIVSDYTLFDVDMDWFIENEEPEECWELIKNFDLDDRRETKDFFDMLSRKFGEAGAFIALWELFTEGYFIDLNEEMKLVASWI